MYQRYGRFWDTPLRGKLRAQGKQLFQELDTSEDGDLEYKELKILLKRMKQVLNVEINKNLIDNLKSRFTRGRDLVPILLLPQSSN